MNLKKWIRIAVVLSFVTAFLFPVHTQLISKTKAAASISLAPASLTSGEVGSVTATAGDGITFDDQTVVVIVKNGQTVAQGIQAVVNPANPSVMTFKVPPLQKGDYQIRFIKQGAPYETGFSVVAQASPSNTSSPYSELAATAPKSSLAVNEEAQIRVTAYNALLGKEDDLTQSSLVTYESLNPDVLSVSPTGRVKGLLSSNGQNAAIKVKLNDGSASYEKTIAFIVHGNSATGSPVASIEVRSAEETIPIHSQLSLQAIATHQDNTISDVTKAVQWESSNPNFADIDQNGIISAKIPGQTTIKATLGDKFGVKNIRIVTSKESEAQNQSDIAGINLSAPKSTLQVNEQVQLQVLALPSHEDLTASNLITYESGNPNVVSVSASGLVTVLSNTPGSYSIKATYRKNNQIFESLLMLSVRSPDAPVTNPAADGLQTNHPIPGQNSPINNKGGSGGFGQPSASNALLGAASRGPIAEIPHASTSLKADLSQNGDKATANVDTTAALEAIAKSGTNEFDIQVPGIFHTIEANVSSEVLKSITEKSDGSLKIQSDRAQFIIPAHALMTEIEKAFGPAASRAEINVAMAAADNLTETKAQSDASKMQSKMIVQPVDFKIEVKSGDRSFTITNFQNAFVTRSFDLQPNLFNPDKATAVLYLPDTRSYRHVPTLFSLSQEGKLKANFKRNGNSIYTVLETDAQFKDVTGSHWAQKNIELMASKLILLGTETGEFYPDNQVTRAEFAAIIVRALGLLPEAPSGQFKDVAPEAWYAGEVQAAFQANIVSGRTNDRFDPGAPILRQEMAQMIVNALRFAGKSPSGSPSNAETLLSRFKDHAQISPYARTSVAFAAEHSIVLGMTDDTFEPQGLATRAQAATMIIKMLRALNFVN